MKRIKSAHPLNLDREKLVQENIRLKSQLNKLETEKMNHKREITNLENEINKKDKIIETMINDTQSNINTENNKVSEMHLVSNVKRQYKELKKAYEKNQQELNATKKNIKYTKINEINMENQIFDEQISKLKNLYEHSLEQKQSLQKHENEFDTMKQALSQKDYIILSFQENFQKMESEIKTLNNEKEKLKNQNTKKDDMILKLKEKLQMQNKENEKLVMKNNNIKKSEIFLSTKNKYEAKMQKLKKDIAQYRDLNSKNERILRDFEKSKNNPQKSLKKFSRKIFSSNYSFEEIKEKNKFFFLCQGINDVLNQIEFLLKDNNKANFKINQNQICLIITTNMPLAPEIIFELKEEKKDISTKVEELNEYIVKSEKDYQKNFELILKENKEMKEKICNIEKQLSMININLGFLPEHYFDRIKEWIGGDKDKIEFTLIFKLVGENKNDFRFCRTVNLSCPQIFIFITENLSIFGSYCPNYKTSGGWIADSNAFLFSLNLNKKYAAKQAKDNYYLGCGYHFTDIEYCSFSTKQGNFGKSGIYLDNYELEGNNSNFYIKHFMVYKVEKI